MLAMILEGDVVEGEWLRETLLAEQIGVSRTPIREAIKRLAAEGALEVHPRRGAQVVSLTNEETGSLFELRARFEPLAVRLSVPRLTDEQLAVLADLGDRMEALGRAKRPDWPEMSRLNNDFHAVFIRNTGNRHLTLAIQTVIRPVLVARTFQTYSPAALERSMRHHAELVDAARIGDADWAEAVMRAHILAAQHTAH